MEKIVVTGGSGLIGQELLSLLHQSGYEAIALRRPYSADSFASATTIINLAGESLSSGRWTKARKKSILSSRVDTLGTIRELVSKNPGTLKTIISASAVGYYGSTSSPHIYSETDPAGTDFLARVCREWEQAADSFESLGIRVVKVRIGVVLSEKGGALPKMMLPLKFGISVPLGSGKQWLPWIHIDDLTQIFLHLIRNPDLHGAFNAAAPNPVTSRDFMKYLAKKKHRIFIPIGVPAFLLKAILGEMAIVTLEGSRVSPAKLIDSGFRFDQPSLH